MDMRRNMRAAAAASILFLGAGAGAAGGGVVALLFAVAVFFGGAGAPLSVATAVATDDCSMLTQTPSRRRGYTGSQPLSNAKRKPQNVSASCTPRRHIYGNFYRAGAVRLDWEVHSDFPTALLSGYCIAQSHESGASKEWCTAAADAAFENSSRFRACVTDASGDKTCDQGTFNFRVRLTTSCDVDLPWSSSVSCDF